MEGGDLDVYKSKYIIGSAPVIPVVPLVLVVPVKTVVISFMKCDINTTNHGYTGGYGHKEEEGNETASIIRREVTTINKIQQSTSPASALAGTSRGSGDIN